MTESANQISHRDYESRIRTVESHLIDGDPVGEIAAMAANAYGISDRQAWRYIAEVRRRWAAAGKRIKRERESLISFNKAIRRREDLYRAAKSSGDVAGALAAEKDRCKLEGLYPEVKKDEPTTVLHAHVHALTAEQRESRLTQILLAASDGCAAIGGPGTNHGQAGALAADCSNAPSNGVPEPDV